MDTYVLAWLVKTKTQRCICNDPRSCTVVCSFVQLKAQFPDAFKAPELAVPPKHTLAALGGQAQHKELLDR